MQHFTTCKILSIPRIYVVAVFRMKGRMHAVDFEMFDGIVALSSEVSHDYILEPIETVRQSFPETWLWTESIIGYLSNIQHALLILASSLHGTLDDCS